MDTGLFPVWGYYECSYYGWPCTIFYCWIAGYIPSAISNKTAKRGKTGKSFWGLTVSGGPHPPQKAEATSWFLSLVGRTDQSVRPTRQSGVLHEQEYPSQQNGCGPSFRSVQNIWFTSAELLLCAKPRGCTKSYGNLTHREMNLMSLCLWSAYSLKGEIQWVINYETITPYSTNTYGPPALLVCWGGGQTTCRENAEPTPLSTGKRAPSWENEFHLEKDRSGWGTGWIGTWNKHFRAQICCLALGRRTSLCPVCPCTLIASFQGVPRVAPALTKALTVTSKPSKQRMFVLDSPLEFMFYFTPTTNGETEAPAERGYTSNVTGQTRFPSQYCHYSTLSVCHFLQSSYHLAKTHLIMLVLEG